MTLKTVTARDEIVKLFAATDHKDLAAFAHLVEQTKSVEDYRFAALQLQVAAGEDYAVVLPHGFTRFRLIKEKK